MGVVLGQGSEPGEDGHLYRLPPSYFERWRSPLFLAPLPVFVLPAMYVGRSDISLSF